ncbi:MAG: DUF3048 domain-containing protein [Clostridiales bacterium]|nr:DUF3048 domain-containing protein [Clostridiales bacterium]
MLSCKIFIKTSFALTLTFLLILAAGCNSDAGKSPTDTTGGDVTTTAQNPSESTTDSSTTTDTDTTETEPDNDNLPQFINPLTGLAADKDLSDIRPAVISINNTSRALPAVGVSQADILIEVSAEGGETRLLMVALDYENIGVIGSVRSARHYMLDFSEDFNGIFIHAGGSPLANSDISQKGINNIDGVNGYTPVNVAQYFYRDSARISTMGLEHSLMITGKNLATAIAKRGYKTELSDGFKFPLEFIDYGKEFIPTGADATNVVIPYSLNYRMQRLAYNKDTNSYFRYHNISAPYIDAANDEHLQFTNVIIIYFDTWVINSTSGILDMELTGTGDGYYIYGGKSMPIKWTRQETGSQMRLTDQNGKPLAINRGKTYIAVARTNMYQGTELNSNKGLS